MRIVKLIAVAGVLLLAAYPAAAQQADAEAPQRIHLDLSSSTDPDAGWECTEWHELYPVYCTEGWHLDKIEGDGQLRACNHAWFNGRRYHIDWVGPTYFLDCLEIVAEPLDPTVTADPTGQVWHEVHPDYCTEHEVTDWEDADADGTVSECDIVVLDGTLVCHVKRVSTDIIISSAPLSTETP